MEHLDFPVGLPAFETYTRFRLVQSANYAELWFLESKEDAELSFPLVPVPLLDPSYQLTLSLEDCITLGVEKTDTLPAQLVCFAIVTAYDELPPTANLLAPVVVNPANRRAVQSVRSDALYSHLHPLTTEVACS